VAAAAAVAVPNVVALNVSPSRESASSVAGGALSQAGRGTRQTNGSASALPSPGGPAPSLTEPSGPVPPNFQPSSVTFVSPDIGWVIGQAGTPGQCANANRDICTSIVRTDDAGKTWHGGPAPGTTGPNGPVAPEDPTRRLAALEQLRAPGVPFVLHLYAGYTGAGGWTAAQQVGDDLAQYTAAGFEVELVLTYRPSDGGSPQDVTGFEQFVRQTLASFGPNPRFVSLQVTNEANASGAPNASDGWFAGAKDALIGGVIAAKAAIQANRYAQVQVGFNWAAAGDADEHSFWSYLASRGGAAFVNALDWVGVDIYPGTWGPALRPLPGGLASGTAAAIRSALKRRELDGGDTAVAVFLPWRGSATFQRLDDLCRGILSGLAPILAHGHPIVLVGDSDVGGLIGIHFCEEMKVATPIVSIDGLELKDFDYIDIGAILDASGAVAVVIKSLVFPASAGVGRDWQAAPSVAAAAS